jgi:predicted nucleic acid-binding protein
MQWLGDERRVFIDTSAFVGLADARDQEAVSANRIMGRMTIERWEAVTSNFILAETHALLLQRRDRQVALDTLRFIERGAVIVLRVSEPDEHRAREIIEQYDDKAFTLTDATSFAVMERLGLRYAFTFDRHFAQFGFSLLMPDSPTRP